VRSSAVRCWRSCADRSIYLADVILQAARMPRSNPGRSRNERSLLGGRRAAVRSRPPSQPTRTSDLPRTRSVGHRTQSTLSGLRCPCTPKVRSEPVAVEPVQSAPRSRGDCRLHRPGPAPSTRPRRRPWRNFHDVEGTIPFMPPCCRAQAGRSAPAPTKAVSQGWSAERLREPSGSVQTLRPDKDDAAADEQAIKYAAVVWGMQWPAASNSRSGAICA
jgi:hypothetical protein